MTRARAFGLDLDASFELEGLDRAAPGGEGERRVRLELATGDDLRATAGSGETERIAQVDGPDGRPAATIDALGDRGYVAWAQDFGSAWIDATGAAVLCAPVDGPPWRWQRFLTGQLLPFAAVLNGLEVFHASAVVVEGRAVAVVAASGSGKTSLGLELALRGLPFLNDDVLVVEPADRGGLLAHPGVPLANVRHDGGTLAERVLDAGLGRALGSTRYETRMAVRRHERPVPLGAILFLRRVDSGERAAIERISPVDPRLLLAATFNLALRRPERLARQLEVCGLVGDSAALFRVDCPPAVAAAELAGEIHRAGLALEAAPS